MSTTQPLRRREDIEQLKSYFLQRRQIRNYTLVIVGINIPLRISDILRLRWCDVFDFHSDNFRKHLSIFESKTQKRTTFYINESAVHALGYLKAYIPPPVANDYIFKATPSAPKPITRITAYHAIKKAADELGFEHISCHSLRKTFGYHAWKSGVHLALITTIYNHSSIQITKRYLGIEQEDKDSVFQVLNL